jgi:DNA-binding ferritin-like protein
VKNLTIQVGDVDDGTHIVQALDKASDDARAEGDDPTADLLAAVANQLRGQLTEQ